MKAELLSLLSFTLGIAAYSVSQLQQQKKLKWQKDDVSFWGEKSHLRKYKFLHGAVMLTEDDWGWKSKWYYRILGIKYRERWFTSTNLTIALTDGYHMCQFIAGIFISLSFVPLLGWTYGIAFWILAHVIHWALYTWLQKK